MKRIISWLLIASLSLSLAACAKPQESTDSASTPSGSPAAEVKNEIIVGSTTELDANFMSGWTNTSANKQIKYLINENGANPVVYTKEGTFEINKSVAEDVIITENADGTKTFTVKLKKDLKWSDGSSITAKDYVFAHMLTSSPEFGEIDGDNFLGEQFVGYDEFFEGTTKTFAGIRLISDFEFSTTVKKEEFPFYYEITLASVTPYPIAVIAPEVTLTDSDKGVTISDNFTTELLTKTINDPATGYRYNPKVTSGAYKFVSFDASSKQAVIEINENYCGTYDSVQPSIQKLIFKPVTTATAMDELAAGSVDILPGFSGGTSINAGLDLVDQGKATYVSYPRAGYGKIAFACNHGPTQFQAVRQAIAYCLDRDEFAKEYSGGFAKVTDGYYGLSQWEYQDNKDAVAKELTHYTLNIEKAKELLVADGWTLNKDGKDFVDGTDTVRYKKIDGALMGLEIEWANSPGNPVSDLLSRMLPESMAKAGMKLNPTTLDLNVLFTELQQQGGSQKYHMFNLGTGFATQSAVWYYYNKDIKTYGGGYNQTFLVDDELHAIAQDMKATPGTDDDAWSSKWLKFQKRWNEVLPEIPLYSDEYHDFISPKLKNYTPDSLWSADFALIYSTVE